MDDKKDVKWKKEQDIVNLLGNVNTMLENEKRLNRDFRTIVKEIKNTLARARTWQEIWFKNAKKEIWDKLKE